MKKYIILLTCTVLGITAALSLPYFVDAVAPEVKAEVLNPKDITSTVVCSGIIEASESVEVSLDSAVIPREIEVSEGDRVSKGDLLFKGDTGALSASTSGSSIERINSPENGIVTSISAVKDKRAAAQTVLMTIAKDDSLTVKIQISENNIADVREGQSVIVTGNGFKGVEYSGKIKRISAIAKNTSSGTVIEAVAELYNTDDRIRPGYTARVSIITKEAEPASVVSYESVSKDENGEFVYVVSENWARKRYVVTGRDSDSGIEILSGVSIGETLVCDASKISHDGQRIKATIG